MYSLEQKNLIRRFMWACSSEANEKLSYDKQVQQLRDIARELCEWVAREHRELFSLFAQGKNIKFGDVIKSAQYLGSLFSSTNSFDRLIILYPRIYDIRFTFCVPNTWLEVLDNLSWEISTLLLQHSGASIEVSDVKEKYGQLRFYYSLVAPKDGYKELDRQIEELIEQADTHVQNIERFQGGL